MAKKLPNKNPPKNIHIKINIYQKKTKKHLTKKSFVQKKHSSKKDNRPIKTILPKIRPKNSSKKNSSKKMVQIRQKKFQNNLSKKCIKQIRPEKFIKKICQINSWKEFVKKNVGTYHRYLYHTISINTHTKEISRFLHFCQWPPLFGKSLTNKQISVLRSSDRLQADSKPENIKSTW